jgi:hypothetical protein
MKIRQLSQEAILVALLAATGVLAGCGSSQSSSATPASPPQSPSPPPPPAAVSISISPSSIAIRLGDTLQFDASVSGSSDTTVTWSIQESSGGSISNTGLYLAPTTDGVYHIVATAHADPTKQATATVNVTQHGFTTVGGLSFARLQHTATLLPSGKVLIAGGGIGPDIIDGFGVVDQAEQFDPATESFSPAGIVSRDAHTATLLNNGSVLLAGGETGWSNTTPIVSNTAELYLAANGSSVATGNMSVGREAHVATLLSDGRVLITGGVFLNNSDWQAIQEAELYDPVAGVFTTAGNTNAPRWGHTATLLEDGKVLITGGDTPSAELFDPATGSFTPTGLMTCARSGHTATLLPNGKVLVVGGCKVEGELYDPSTGSFTPTGTTSAPRYLHTATLLPNGTVLIAGGGATGGATDTTEIYDPATDSFIPGPTMRQGRYMHTATLLPNGDVLISGGANSPDLFGLSVLNSAEIYH